MASQEGILAFTQNGKGVIFTHDSVNEAAYCLLEQNERALYHLELGKKMHANVCINLMQKYIFTIAAQIARGNDLVTDDNDRITMANIFYTAGEKSMTTGAFPEARFFFNKGIKLLNESDWANNYRLCCDIYMKAADTAALTADFRDMDKLLKVLFSNCKDSMVDYLNASSIQAKSLLVRTDQRSLTVCLGALRYAGVKFPTNNLAMHTVKGLAKTRYLINNLGVEKLLRLPPIKDKQIMAILRLLHQCVILTISFNQKLIPLVIFRIIELNLKHGMSKEYPMALALYGALLGRVGYSLSEAEKYLNIALVLQEESKLMSDENLAHLTFLTHGLTFTMTKKLPECLAPLRIGYDAGLRTGKS